MAATAAAIAVGVSAAVAAGTQAYAASQSGKKKQTQVNQATPQQQAIQDISSRLLIGRYNQGPQTFGNYRTAGPRPYPQADLTPNEATTLGFIPSQATRPWMLPNGSSIMPQMLDPNTLAAMQQSFTPAAMAQRALNPGAAPPQPWTGSFGGLGNQYLISGDPGEVLNHLRANSQPQVMQALLGGQTPAQVQARFGSHGGANFPQQPMSPQGASILDMLTKLQGGGGPQSGGMF